MNTPTNVNAGECSPASYEEFLAQISRAKCPICLAPMSDDGCDSNVVYRDQEGVLWEYYNGPRRYGHQTVACRNQHHFKVEDAKLGHIENQVSGAPDSAALTRKGKP